MFREEAVRIDEMAGMGENVVKFVRKDTDEVICFVGKKEDKDFVYFSKPTDAETLVTIAEILDRKKMRKALDKGDFKKAQKIADKGLDS